MVPTSPLRRYAVMTCELLVETSVVSPRSRLEVAAIRAPVAFYAILLLAESWVRTELSFED